MTPGDSLDALLGEMEKMSHGLFCPAQTYPLGQKCVCWKSYLPKLRSLLAEGGGLTAGTIWEKASEAVNAEPDTGKKLDVVMSLLHDFSLGRTPVFPAGERGRG